MAAAFLMQGCGGPVERLECPSIPPEGDIETSENDVTVPVDGAPESAAPAPPADSPSVSEGSAASATTALMSSGVLASSFEQWVDELKAAPGGLRNNIDRYNGYRVSWDLNCMGSEFRTGFDPEKPLTMENWHQRYRMFTIQLGRDSNLTAVFGSPYPFEVVALPEMGTLETRIIRGARVHVEADLWGFDGRSSIYLRNFVITSAEERASAKEAITLSHLETDLDKLNYAVGVEIGETIKQNGLHLSETVFEKGIYDGMEGRPLLMSRKEMRRVKEAHSLAWREERQKAREARESSLAGERFLEENGSKEGVITTRTGLQYQILKAGKGARPKETDRVSVNYRGTFIDGTEFDSSYERGRSATFNLNRVIKGWTEALQLMPVGSKWRVFLPADLAYGERGAGGKIGPHTVLIFEIELLEIQPE